MGVHGQVVACLLLTLEPVAAMFREHKTPRSPPLRRPSPRMEISVCNGGACTKNGALLLVEACSVFAANDAKIEVKTIICSGECPFNLAMISPVRGTVEAYAATCNTLESAIDSAEAALATAGASVEPSLRTAFVLIQQSKEAEAAGEFPRALEGYDAVLKAAPANLLEPRQATLALESLEWQGSQWGESLFSSDLVLGSKGAAESDGAVEFGACGGGQAIVDKKVVTTPRVSLLACTVQARQLSGQWVDSAGLKGTFELTMSENGHSFTGVLRYEGDVSREPRPWRGVRKAAKGVRARGRPAKRAEAPPSPVKWLHDAYLAKARCHLARGDVDAAVEEARAATVLCCRAPSGWVALAEALEASASQGRARGASDAAGAAAAIARAEVEYLEERSVIRQGGA